jgi:hypothetical protein
VYGRFHSKPILACLRASQSAGHARAIRWPPPAPQGDSRLPAR